MSNRLAGAESFQKVDGNLVLSVQYLRAAAALLVVFNHAAEQFPALEGVVPSAMGLAGVDLFFVISGFIMVCVTHVKPRSPTEFLIMRTIRIVPIYWFFNFVEVLLILLTPGLFRGNMLTANHLLLSVLFIPHPNPLNPADLSPFVKLGWTLNYEMFFYALFALSMAVFPKQRTVVAVIVLLALSASGLFWADSNLAIIRFYTNSILLEFALGMAIGNLFVRGYLVKLGVVVSTLLILFGFGALVISSTHIHAAPRLVLFGLPAAAIVLGAVSVEQRGWTPRMSLALAIGNASYSIYLVHMFPIAILRVSVIKLGIAPSGPAGMLVFVLISLILASIAGYISYLCLEKPSLKWMRRLLMRLRSRAHKSGGAVANTEAENVSREVPDQAADNRGASELPRHVPGPG